jgi:hypothetical protein
MIILASGPIVSAFAPEYILNNPAQWETDRENLYAKIIPLD